MKFLTYRYQGVEDIGVLNEDKGVVVSLRDLFNHMGEVPPADMNDFLRIQDDNLIDKLRLTLKSGEFKGIEVKNVKVLAPIPYPRRNIICIGKNYLGHALETSKIPGGTPDIPEHPIFFSKIAYPAIGDGDVVKGHWDINDSLDYEVELGVIIGKDGMNIPKEKVEEHIFGYTIVNDITSRNLQKKHGQWLRGKSLDTFCPMGPYIVHKSEIPFPVELDIQSKVNGEIRQNSNTRNFIFDIPYIISELSKGIRLIAGDIIITGTPEGVGTGFNPPKYLKPGDIIECYIERIGTLRNIIE